MEEEMSFDLRYALKHFRGNNYLVFHIWFVDYNKTTVAFNNNGEFGGPKETLKNIKRLGAWYRQKPSRIELINSISDDGYAEYQKELKEFINNLVMEREKDWEIKFVPEKHGIGFQIIFPRHNKETMWFNDNGEFGTGIQLTENAVALAHWYLKDESRINLISDSMFNPEYRKYVEELQQFITNLEIEMTDRGKSATWWKTLSDETKAKYWKEYTHINWSPSINYTELTGREIQFIWNGKEKKEKTI